MGVTLQIIAAFCIFEDVLKGLRHQEDSQCQMSDAEIMTTALVAAMYYDGNYASACEMLKEQGYIPNMLGPSRFNRRLHRIKELFLTVFAALAEHWKELNTESIYSVDSFPVAVCDNYRISRSKIYHDEAYRGRCASKKRYFYGVKVHLLVTQNGLPVEVLLTPGSVADVTTLKSFAFDLPAGSTVYADRGYTDYNFEDDFNSVDGEIGNQFLPMRRSNSKRPFPPWIRYLQHCHRKIVETAGSLVERLMPKSIHAVTAAGFELKVILFVLASSLKFARWQLGLY